MKLIIKFLRFISAVFAHYFKVEDRASAAALAYYAVFALAPILLIILTILGQFVGGDLAIQQRLLNQLSTNIDPSVTTLVVDIIAQLNNGNGITVARIFGFVSLTFAVSTLINYLQQSLNAIFATDFETKRFARWLRLQLLSWVVMIVFGGLWVASFVAEVITNWIKNEVLEIPLWFGEITSFVWITLFLMSLFQVLIIHRISLKNLFIGAVLTAALLRLARIAFNWYVWAFDVASAYGATASVIMFLLWLFVSAHSVYFGACSIAVLEGKTD